MKKAIIKVLLEKIEQLEKENAALTSANGLLKGEVKIARDNVTRLLETRRAEKSEWDIAMLKLRMKLTGVEDDCACEGSCNGINCWDEK